MVVARSVRRRHGVVRRRILNHLWDLSSERGLSTRHLVEHETEVFYTRLVVELITLDCKGFQAEVEDRAWTTHLARERVEDGLTFESNGVEDEVPHGRWFGERVGVDLTLDRTVGLDHARSLWA